MFNAYVSGTQSLGKIHLYMTFYGSLFVSILSLIGLIYFFIFYKSNLIKTNAFITSAKCNFNDSSRSCIYNQRLQRNVCSNNIPLDLRVNYQYSGKNYKNIFISKNTKNCNSLNLKNSNIDIYVDPKNPSSPLFHGSIKKIMIIICLIVFVISCIIALFSYLAKDNKTMQTVEGVEDEVSMVSRLI